MDLRQEVPQYHQKSLVQYDGTICNKKAIFSYGAWESDGLKLSALNARYGDSEKHTVDNQQAIKVNNDEVICVVEKSPGAYEIKTVVTHVTGPYQRPERKLRVLSATNLPPDFLQDNRISRLYPFLHPSLDVDPLEREIPSRFYVVVSTHSGQRLAEDFYQKTIQPLLASGDKYEQAHEKVVTDSEKSITNFVRNILLKEANNGAWQTVLLLSGDGGVVDTVNALLSGERSAMYQKPAIGLVAMGTGNALAHSTELSRDRTLGLRHFFRGNPRSLPTFTVEFSPGSAFLVNEGRDTEPMQTNNKGEGVVYGAVVCSWALHASIVADSDTTEYRKHGNERFIMAAKALLRPSDGSPTHQYKGFVSYSRARDSGKVSASLPKQGPLHAYVLATMVSHLEPGFNISPYSTPLDGKLRALRLGPMAANAMEGIMGKAFQDGSHVNDSAVTYEDVQSMRVQIQEEDPRWRRVCVDGKIICVPEGGWFEVKKNEEEDVLDIIA